MSDSQLFGLFLRRRGGLCYVLALLFWMAMMVATNTLIFSWLNSWMNSPDNTRLYYYNIYVLLLVSGVFAIAAHCYMEFNSDFFNQMHKMMISRLLVAPMSYFETTSVANTMNKLSSDLKKIDSEVVTQFRTAVFFVCLGTSFFINSVMIYLRKHDPVMIIVMAVLVLVVAYYYYYFIVAEKQIHRL